MMKRSRTAINTHPNRLQMERLYIQGESIAKIARDFGVSEESLRNHCQNNISRQLVQAWAHKELTNSFNLLGEIDEIIVKAKNIFDRNYAKEADVTALKALSEQRATLELLCKISAYLHESKLLEAQQNRAEIEKEIEDDQRALVAEGLDILTKAEFNLYSALNEKLITKDSSIKILPDGLDDEELLKLIRSFYPVIDHNKINFKRSKKKQTYKDITDTEIFDSGEEKTHQEANNSSDLDKDSKVRLNSEEEEYPDWYVPGKRYFWINDKPQEPASSFRRTK